MTDPTMVLSTQEATERVRVPSIFTAQESRLRWMLENELDEAGEPLWALAEGRFTDICGLPDRRWIHLWRTTDSAIEAFETLGKRVVEEGLMLGFNVSIRDTGCGFFVVTLEAVEKLR
jgi:hypothetical protein